MPSISTLNHKQGQMPSYCEQHVHYDVMEFYKENSPVRHYWTFELL